MKFADNIQAMAFQTDPLFNEVFGFEFSWTQFITSIVIGRWGERFRGAALEDVVTDAVTKLYLDAKNPENGLHRAIVKAKAEDTDLQSAMQKIVREALTLRVRDWMRHSHRRGGYQRGRQGQNTGSAVHQFSQCLNGTMIAFVVDRSNPTFDADLAGYERLIQDELEKMAVAAERNRQGKLAARYRRTIAVVPDRVAEMRMDDLMEKHGIKSKSMVQAIYDDIKQALARVAGRLQDPTLMYGTSSFATG